MSVVPLSTSTRRERLREAVAKMADAMATGACTPSRVELEALALVCEDQFLPTEAARVRRWMTP